MLKKDVTYQDFNGEERTDTFYFNLTEPEVVRLDVEFPGGLQEYINNFNEEEPQNILNLFEKVIRESYGEKSKDGRYFIKDPESTDRFYQSAAYSALFVELVQDAEKASVFFNALLTRTAVSE